MKFKKPPPLIKTQMDLDNIMLVEYGKFYISQNGALFTIDKKVLFSREKADLYMSQILIEASRMHREATGPRQQQNALNLLTTAAIYPLRIQ